MRSSYAAPLWLTFLLLQACSGTEEGPVTTPLPPPTSAAHPGQNFTNLADDYLDYHFRTLPIWGTLAGYHRYDHRFFDFRQASMQKTLIGIR